MLHDFSDLNKWYKSETGIPISKFNISMINVKVHQEKKLIFYQPFQEQWSCSFKNQWRQMCNDKQLLQHNQFS